MGIENCSCGRRKLAPVGPKDSPFLIILDEPDDEEMNNGMPLSGRRGKVVFGEFSRVGLELRKARITYVNQHSMEYADKASEYYKACEGHLNDAIHEMKNRKGVLIMGARASLPFDIKDVGKRSGLVVTSPYFPASTGFVMVTTAPPTNDLIGEFRLAVEKFAKKLKEA